MVPTLDGYAIRIVQTNTDAFIVQEKVGVLFFSWWSTWRNYFFDCDFISYFTTEENARDAIRRVLESRRQEADAKVFKRRVVWPRP